MGWFGATVVGRNPDGTYLINFPKFNDDIINIPAENIRIKSEKDVTFLFFKEYKINPEILLNRNGRNALRRRGFILF